MQCRVERHMDLLGTDYPYSSSALVGKHALVCGASKGIGAATAKFLAKAGANVTVCARNSDALDDLCNELSTLGNGSHSSLVLDLENTDAIKPAIESLLSTKGAIHILINNSAGPKGGPLLGVELEDFTAPFKRHLHAAHTMVQAVVAAMETEGYGRIIQIISTSVKEPIPNLGLSNTLRGAMASWSKTLSRELPACITINNVLPGFTDTERLGSLAASINEKTGRSVDLIHDTWMTQVPIGRLVDPLETASAITFLTLPSSGAIRGVSLAVDGGRLRSI